MKENRWKESSQENNTFRSDEGKQQTNREWKRYKDIAYSQSV